MTMLFLTLKENTKIQLKENSKIQLKANITGQVFNEKERNSES